ncbi:ABC transporter ATP-binding protein [Caldalkalibacillus mannanilyticus]|uniref:ABC transporter ATP-binding protein n=1 Tax=Caldalkalibacillus mannanilyticus TaxID=1418 RepID=UPI000469B17F|nr:ABC transporter ATP-binding protein [Caldalkalibacillus mannanilyticus]
MLRIQDVSYTYDHKNLVLDQISFDVQIGDFLAIVGPNGCGKTTLIKLICDLLKKQNGEITLNNCKNSDLQVKKSILYLPSEDIIPDFLTGREYVQLILNFYTVTLDEEFFERLLRYYSFHSAIDLLIEEYSHGMKKKIQIIASLLVNPLILIIDETLNGMDIESREVTKLLLTQYSKKGGTVILCSHDLHLLEEICQSVIILYKGHIHFHNRMSEVKEQHTNLTDMLKKIMNHGDIEHEIISD